LPRRLTSVTVPGTSPRSAWPAMMSYMRRAAPLTSSGVEGTMSARNHPSGDVVTTAFGSCPLNNYFLILDHFSILGRLGGILQINLLIMNNRWVYIVEKKKGLTLMMLDFGTA
jgi:hypothetical protein